MDPLYVLLVAVLWVGIGVAAATLALGRRGYRDKHWLVLGVVLGPLFVPIAMERARRESVEVEHLVVAREGAASPAGTGPVLLVALDGSAESDRALKAAARLVGEGPGRLVLACVLGREVGEGEDPEAHERARRMLESKAAQLDHGADIVILAGQPAGCLLEAAEQEGADVIVVGRRGRGVSSRLLGGVAAELARHSPVPVLLAPGGGR